MGLRCSVIVISWLLYTWNGYTNFWTEEAWLVTLFRLNLVIAMLSCLQDYTDLSYKRWIQLCWVSPTYSLHNLKLEPFPLLIDSRVISLGAAQFSGMAEREAAVRSKQASHLHQLSVTWHRRVVHQRHVKLPIGGQPHGNLKSPSGGRYHPGVAARIQ